MAAVVSMEPVRPRKGVSETALVTAHARSHTDIPYAGKILEIAKGMRRRDSTEDPEEQGRIERVGYAMAPQLEARHLLISQLLEESRVTQILEIASGLSSRGVYMTQADPQLRYVELELPGMSHLKKDVVRLLLGPGNKPRNLHFEAGNALDVSDLKEAIRGFDPNEPIAIMHEGMMRYFTFPQKATFAGHVKDILYYFKREAGKGEEERVGSWITPDITLRAVMNAEDNHNVEQNRLLAGMAEMDIHANAFESVEEARVFFRELGFTMTEHRYTEVAKQLVSPGRLDMSKKEARALIEDAVAVVMKPFSR